MAAQATTLSSSSQSSADKEFDDNLAFQLINSVNPGNSVINLSFVAAREVYGEDLDELKATIASVRPHPKMRTKLIFRSEHFTQHFQAPISQVDLSVSAVDNNIMATPAEYGSPVITDDTASPEVGPHSENEVTNSAAPKKAKQKVARPPNAFIIYRKDWHAAIVAENPGVHNNAICKQESDSLLQSFC